MVLFCGLFLGYVVEKISVLFTNLLQCLSKQLWDVRNVMSPLKEFTGHTKGNDTCRIFF